MILLVVHVVRALIGIVLVRIISNMRDKNERKGDII